MHDGGDYLELVSESGDAIRVLRRMHPRARRLRLTVTASGARVTYPQGTHPSRVTAFLREHDAWLRRKLAELHPPAARIPLTPGLTTLIPLHGEPMRLCWRSGTYPRIEKSGDRIVLWLPKARSDHALATARGLLRGFLEARMLRDVNRHLGNFVAQLGAAPSSVRVRPLKSLWGSLDTRDRMSLDLALSLVPAAALRYVTIHELCHLRVRSHAPRFWRCVESFEPNWRDQREWLREHGQATKAELTRLIGG